MDIIVEVEKKVLVNIDGGRGPQGIQGIDGENGENIELQNSGTFIQWRVVGGVAWTNLIAVADLQGNDGNDGREIELQNTGTFIQWRYVGESWTNLISIASITGPQGPKGDTGDQGPQGIQGIQGETGPAGTTDHGLLIGLGDDDHTQYMLLSGRVGGQTLSGNLTMTNDLYIASSSAIYKNSEKFIHTSGGGGGGSINENLFIGYQAGSIFVGTGYANTIIGRRSGLSLNGTSPNASSNTVMGYGTFGVATTASFNTIFGTASGSAITTQVRNTFIGYHCGLNAITNGAVAIGDQALAGAATGTDNLVAIGKLALNANTSGVRNTACGAESLELLTTNSDNTGFGYKAGYGLTGEQNTCVGSNVGAGVGNGGYNTIIGARAAFVISNGNTNSIFGREAGFSISSGSENTLLGANAGYFIGIGSRNVFVGRLAGDNVTSGNNNIIIGYNIDATSATVSNTLNIGNLIFGSGIDGSGTTLSSGRIGIGVSSPSASAKLEIASTTQGFLLPRMTTAQINAIVSPGNGLLAFNTTLNKLCHFNGSIWEQLSTTPM